MVLAWGTGKILKLLHKALALNSVLEVLWLMGILELNYLLYSIHEFGLGNHLANDCPTSGVVSCVYSHPVRLFTFTTHPTNVIFCFKPIP